MKLQTFVLSMITLFSTLSLAAAPSALRTSGGCDNAAMASAVKTYIGTESPSVLTMTDEKAIEYFRSYKGDVFVKEVKSKKKHLNYTIEFYEEHAWDGGSEAFPPVYYKVDVEAANCRVISATEL